MSTESRIIAGVRARRTTSVHERLSLPTPAAMREATGHLCFAIFPLEDWCTAAPRPSHFTHLPHGFHRLLLADRGDGDPTATFAINWDQGWHPQLFVKWAPGRFYPELLAPVQKPFALCGHFAFHRLQWYHLSLTWDHGRGLLRLYVNGVRVAAEDRFLREFGGTWEPAPVGPVLHYGGQDHFATEPEFGPGFWDDAAAAAGFADFAHGAGNVADAAAIAAIHAGSIRPASPPPAEEWPRCSGYGLRSEDDLKDVHRQGGGQFARITLEGLEIRTPRINPVHQLTKDRSNENHLYLWFPDFIEGDLRIDYDFQILAHGGLSLFIAQAAGMQGERFLEDYPRRTTGAMRMICWEDVRNYHLEYYREMNDVRNDVATFALMKNPWLRPLGFATRTRSWELHRWYHLCFTQEAGCLRLFIDDDLILDARDEPDSNNGPLLQRGYFALRCMVRTAMRFRDLTLRWRPLLP